MTLFILIAFGTAGLGLFAYESSRKADAAELMGVRTQYAKMESRVPAGSDNPVKDEIGSEEPKVNKGQGPSEEPKPALPVISTELVRAFQNRECIVEFRVRSVGKSRNGQFLFLNSEQDKDASNNFLAFITPEGSESLKRSGIADPLKEFGGRLLRVKGTIEPYREALEIVVRDASQIEVLTR